MLEKSLPQIHHEQEGKVSDKWELYLDEYDQRLHSYRTKPVRLLEIGIQNGGSLEIWTQYFPQAKRIIGCDINPNCAKLTYSDPKISVIIGDATKEQTYQRIHTLEQTLDIIIDDGSHQSADIIKAFSLYFPALTDGGVFIVEDLHCSYWQEFSGGLFHPLSSIAFFKSLVDIVNGEHWGTEAKRTKILEEFFIEYDCSISEKELEHIHSVEFINSMCVIHKKEPAKNKLGTRQIGGQVDKIVPVTLFSAPDQSASPWLRSSPPIKELQLEISHLNQALAERNAEIIQLTKTLVIEKEKAKIQHIMQSISWQITLPIRLLKTKLRACLRFF